MRSRRRSPQTASPPATSAAVPGARQPAINCAHHGCGRFGLHGLRCRGSSYSIHIFCASYVFSVIKDSEKAWQYSAVILITRMRNILRFLWNSTRGHRLAPWRSPYLRWRIETYTGIKMHSIGFLEFSVFMFRERRELLRFLQWTGEMERYARVKPKNP